MDLRLLRYFLAVCENGTSTARPPWSRRPTVPEPADPATRDRSRLRPLRSLRPRTLAHRRRPSVPPRRRRPTHARDPGERHRPLDRARDGVGSHGRRRADHRGRRDLPFIVHAGAEGVIGNAIDDDARARLRRGRARRADFAVGTHPASRAAFDGARACLPVGADAGVASLREPAEHPHRRARAGAAHRDEPRARGASDARLGRRAGRTRFHGRGRDHFPVLAQALAAAGRGICVLSDDPHYDLAAVPISAPGGELIITLFGVWDEMHYASAHIAACLEELSAFNAELYPQTVKFGATARSGDQPLVAPGDTSRASGRGRTGRGPPGPGRPHDVHPSE